MYAVDKTAISTHPRPLFHEKMDGLMEALSSRYPNDRLLTSEIVMITGTIAGELNA